MYPRVLIIQNDITENLGLYQSFLLANGAEVYVLKAYESMEVSYPAFDTFTHFIVGPTPISANDVQRHPFLIKEWDYLSRIVSSNKPTLGVCCGGQMLARLLGADVVKSPRKEVGGYTISLTDAGMADPIFSGFPRYFSVFQWHSDMFKIPHGGALLAEGDPCPIQAFALNNVRGLIFHLEIDHLEAERWVTAYPSEPNAVDKTNEQVISECMDRESEMRMLAQKLISNFMEMI